MAMYKLEEDPNWGTGPSAPPPLYEKLPSGESTYFISFNKEDFNDRSICCYSVNNFFNPSPVDGWRGPSSVPPYSCQLVSIGKERGIERRVEVLLKMIDTALLTSGKITINNNVYASSLVDSLPVSIHSNSRAYNPKSKEEELNNAITITGSGNIKGKVSACGSVHVPQIVPEGGTQELTFPINIPIIDIENVIQNKFSEGGISHYVDIPADQYIFDIAGGSPVVFNKDGPVSSATLHQWGWVLSKQSPGCVLTCKKNLKSGGDLSLRLTTSAIQNYQRLLITSDVTPPAKDIEFLARGNLTVTGSFKGSFEIYSGGKTTIYGSSEAEIDASDIAIYSHDDMAILTYEPSLGTEKFSFFNGLVYTHGNAIIRSPDELPELSRQSIVYKGLLIATSASDPHGLCSTSGNFFTNNETHFFFDPDCITRLKFLNSQKFAYTIAFWNEF
ncbi:MAG: hypothetical protein RDV48_05655 [Candidatus Eremiobacteraeota bacterium]|nr:hypothetical protein [Candidatus Eremiobacteraeota bacterium]